MNSTSLLPSSPRPADRFGRWLLAGGALLLLNWAIVEVGPWYVNANDTARAMALTTCYMAAGMLLLLALAWLWRSVPTVRLVSWIIVAGLAMRLLAFSQPPYHETDYYRYLWDGAVSAHGYNPYAIRPADALERRAIPHDANFQSLAEAGDETLRRINHSYLTTIYPPVAQVLFAVAHWISPFSANALRVVFLGVDVAMLILLLVMLRHLRLPLHWVAIYWWNPIAIKETYVSAHMDVLVAFAALAAVAAGIWRWRRASMVLLGVAMGIKVWPVVLAPILVRNGARSWRRMCGSALLLATVAGLLLWPLAASWGREETSGINAYAHQWIANAGFFSFVLWCMQSLHNLGLTLLSDPAVLARWLTLGMLLAWMAIIASRRLLDGAAVARWSMLAVGGLFVLSPAQFPWYYLWLLPFLAFSPARPLLVYTALLPLYHIQYDHPWVLWIEHLPVWMMIGWSAWRHLRPARPARRQLANTTTSAPPPGVRVAVVIPALNEEQAIGRVLADIPPWVQQVVVADNGSTDRTSAIAKERGATVVFEPRRGYGAACLAAIAALDRPDIVVFLDADFSDRPGEIPALLTPILANEADLVIGSRVLGEREVGSLSPQQRFGNALACWLIRMLYGASFTDLGPFRAIRYASLTGLQMDDTTYGWTVQMQTRAVRMGMRCAEVHVSYHRRIGRSKISGTLRGMWGAGVCIISTIFAEVLRKHTGECRIIVFARWPEPGKTKTRLIPMLGPEGAAKLHRQMAHMALHHAARAAATLAGKVEVRYTGGSADLMRRTFGPVGEYRDQGEGDLGQRMYRAIVDAFGEGRRRLVIIGTDCPSLTNELSTQAMQLLGDHDLVLGPAADGGYYLIALNRPIPELFAGIEWSSDKVLAQTLEIANRLRLSVRLLPVLGDVDIADDLRGLVRQRTDAQVPISVIIPAHNEATNIAAAIAAAGAAPDAEVIVVDGESTDETAAIARRCGATVLSCPPSPGDQQQLGALQAHGRILMFLHADTLLPSDWAQYVSATIDAYPDDAGAFRVRFNVPGGRFRLIERIVPLRSAWLPLSCRDQWIVLRQYFTAQPAAGLPSNGTIGTEGPNAGR